MKNSNRIARYISVYILSFILTASSIPNIYANTNPENPQDQVSEQKAEQTSETQTAVAPQEKSTAQEAPADENPVDIHLDYLGRMCSHILDRLEKNTWNLSHDDAQKKALLDGVKVTLDIVFEILDTFKDKKPGLHTQVLCEIIIHNQLEYVNDLLLRKQANPAQLETRLKEAEPKEFTQEDLSRAIATSNDAFQALHESIQAIEKINLDDEATETFNKKEKSDLDRTNDQVLKQLCSVETILEEQGQFIESQSLKVPNKAAAIDAIKKVRRIIEARKYDRGAVTENSIHDLLVLNEHIMKHVQTIIRSNFTQLPTFNEDVLTTRGKREVTIEELDAKYRNNEKILINLRDDSQYAGLKRYHLICRAIEPYWTKTLDGGRRIAWPLLFGFLSTVALQQADLLPAWFDFKIPGTNGMWFYGDRWSAKKEGAAFTPPDNPSRIGLVSNVYHGVTPFSTNALVLSIAGLAYYYGRSDFKLMKDAANDYMARLSSFLLGRKISKKNDQITILEPRYTFKDVIGQQEIKNTLSKIVRYFEDPQGIDNRGLDLPKGYLFTGETRSGKSFMAEALAGEIRAAIRRSGRDEKAFKFLVAPQEILRQSGGFHLCMEHARRYAPCIVFIDEIHLLELQTGKNSALLNEFLTELSGVMNPNNQSKVFVIAATNKEDTLDVPLRTSGRLSNEIRFEYPTYADRRTFISGILERRTINVQSDKWTRAINQLARESENRTYEDLRTTIEDAFITAKNNGASLEPEYLTRSFDVNMRGIIFESDREISRQDQEIAAAHQAGYVLATRLLAPYLSIAKVTILPIKEGTKETSIWSQFNQKAEDKPKRTPVPGRMFTYGNKNHEQLMTVQEHINACAIDLSGVTAGKLLLGKANNSEKYLKDKRQEALDIAKGVISKGMNIDEFDDSFKRLFIARVMSFLNACEAKSALLMGQNKEALQALYAELLKRKTLTGTQIDAILARYTLSNSTQDDAILDIIDTVANPA
jgi:cell division protease FtsH